MCKKTQKLGYLALWLKALLIGAHFCKYGIFVTYVLILCCPFLLFFLCYLHSVTSCRLCLFLFSLFVFVFLVNFYYFLLIIGN